MKVTITLDPEGPGTKHVSWRPGLPDNEVYPGISETIERLEALLRESIAVGHKPGYSLGEVDPG